jgi:hypothetical protein
VQNTASCGILDPHWLSSETVERKKEFLFPRPISSNHKEIKKLLSVELRIRLIKDDRLFPRERGKRAPEDTDTKMTNQKNNNKLHTSTVVLTHSDFLLSRKKKRQCCGRSLLLLFRALSSVRNTCLTLRSATLSP